MATRRNERKVTDWLTGESVSQYLMLKKLFNDSGLGRNEWYEKAKVAGITGSSPQNLSSILNGSRDLPMNHIVPYIKAFGFTRKKQEYYIAEFFKAYCEENLHPYIGKGLQAKKVFLQEQKIINLQSKIKNLQTSMFFKNNVETVGIERVYEQKISEQASLNKILLRWLQSPVKPKMVDYKDQEKFDVARNDWQGKMFEYENDLSICNELTKDESVFYETDNESYDMKYYKAVFSREQALNCQKIEIKKWNESVNELKKLSNNAEDWRYLSVLFPNDFTQQLISFLHCAGDIDFDPGQQEISWQWVAKRVKQRTIAEVAISKLNCFRLVEPTNYRSFIDSMLAYITTTPNERLKGSKIFSEERALYDTFNSKWLAKVSEYPRVFELMRPIDSNLTSYSYDDHVTFNLQLSEYIGRGLDKPQKFAAFYENVSPSMIEIDCDLKNICYLLITNECFPIKSIENESSLARGFIYHGNAAEFHETPVAFLKSKIDEFGPISDIQKVAASLVCEQYSMGESKYWTDFLAEVEAKSSIYKKKW